MVNITNERVINEISKLMFEYFVANENAIAIQKDDGIYKPVYLNYTSDIFSQMIIQKQSLAVYQQKMYSHRIKWICFDFDIKKGSTKSVNELFNKYVLDFLRELDGKEIKYLVEFSGRRGIHVWVIFDSYISKEIGFEIVINLSSEINKKLKSDNDFALDLFPAVARGRRKVGKAVKVPLSVHKRSNKQSYFIKDITKIFTDKIDISDGEISIDEQLEILQDYKPMSVEHFNLNKTIKKEKNRNLIIYKKHRATYTNGEELSLAEVIESTRDSIAFQQLWGRVTEGNMIYEDRLVVTGLFSHFGNGELLTTIFSLQENFDSDITRKKLINLKDQLFPISMSYFYDIYRLDMEDHINPEKTVLEFIGDRLPIIISDYPKEESIEKAKSITQKELNYLLYNDEVIHPSDYYDMKNMYTYDYDNLEKQVKTIIEGKYNDQQLLTDFKVYFRKEEKKEKERMLVSLSTRDRILTTMLTCELVERIKWRFDSYSYNINLWNDKDIFFPWFNSWNKFTNDIRLFLDLSLFDNYGFMKLDISSFYDSIYLHSIYKQMLTIAKEKSEKDYKEIKNIFDFLVNYNQSLMVKCTGDVKGVPQGPVYARVLAEFFISTVIKQFRDDEKLLVENCKILRYVDDIYIVYKKDGSEILELLTGYLKQRGLTVNPEKTRDYGLISEINKEVKDSIFKNTQWNYSLMQIVDMELLTKEQYKAYLDFFKSYLTRNEEWNINDANFILGGYIDDIFIKKYIIKYMEKLVSSCYGRGSIFRKLYEFIFFDENITNVFYRKKMYTIVPFNSVNMQNLFSVLFFSNHMEMGFCNTAEYSSMIKYFDENILGSNQIEKQLFALLKGKYDDE